MNLRPPVPQDKVDVFQHTGLVVSGSTCISPVVQRRVGLETRSTRPLGHEVGRVTLLIGGEPSEVGVPAEALTEQRTCSRGLEGVVRNSAIPRETTDGKRNPAARQVTV